MHFLFKNGPFLGSTFVNLRRGYLTSHWFQALKKPTPKLPPPAHASAWSKSCGFWWNFHFLHSSLDKSNVIVIQGVLVYIPWKPAWQLIINIHTWKFSIGKYHRWSPTLSFWESGAEFCLPKKLSEHDAHTPQYARKGVGSWGWGLLLNTPWKVSRHKKNSPAFDVLLVSNHLETGVWNLGQNCFCWALGASIYHNFKWKKTFLNVLLSGNRNFRPKLSNCKKNDRQWLVMGKRKKSAMLKFVAFWTNPCWGLN